jgi:hypothetical protein
LTLGPPGLPLPAHPAVTVLLRRLRLVRIYGPGHRWNERRRYGPLPDTRFDHHRPPLGTDAERSVWYSSRALLGAVGETYGKRGFLDRSAGDRVVVARVAAPIRLVDLVGVAARRFGLTQEIAATTDYVLSQEWARAFYDRYGMLAGIRWRGKETGSICIVLTDRAPLRVLDKEADLPITDVSVWPRIARAAQACGVRVV